MHQLATGATTGGSLALVYRLLTWADRQPWYPPAAEVCEALQVGGWKLDWPSFVFGVVAGITLYVAIEFVVTLRWAFINWASSLRVSSSSALPPSKPSFKFIA